MSDPKVFTLPPCRIVQGSLYEPQTTDATRKPLTTKAGKPRVNYFFAVAVPKGNERHWNETPWGKIIYEVGKQAFPQKHVAPQFAWKVTDGDSEVPNGEGYRPCDNEGFPKNWVVRLSGGYAPTILDVATLTPILETDFIKLGDWVEVAGNVTDNGTGSNPNPGVFLNHSHVGFRATGIRITPRVSIDPTSLNFGAAPLPPGVGDTPAPQGTSMTAGQPPAPPAPPAPPVAPHNDILNLKTMTPKANGLPYEAWIKEGWNDADLIEQGYMLA